MNEKIKIKVWQFLAVLVLYIICAAGKAERKK
jgi:hypothetical protein